MKKKKPRPSVPNVQAAQPVMQPTLSNSWPYFGFLIITAVVGYFAGKVVLVGAAIWFFVMGWIWLARRFPLTMWFLLGFLRGLMGRRRY